MPPRARSKKPPVEIAPQSRANAKLDELRIMFKDVDWKNEDAFYDRILRAWNDAELSEEDADTWLSKFVLDILDEDRRNARRKDRTLARVITNCLILALALTNKKPADLRGFKSLADLSDDERGQILKDLSCLVDE